MCLNFFLPYKNVLVIVCTKSMHTELEIFYSLLTLYVPNSIWFRDALIKDRQLRQKKGQGKAQRRWYWPMAVLNSNAVCDGSHQPGFRVRDRLSLGWRSNF